MLFALIFCCNTTYGQILLLPKDSAVIKQIDDLPAYEPFDSANSYRYATKPFVYIISNTGVYNIFGYKLSVKYREFNFSQHHILGIPECEGCDKWVWLMRDNKKAFAEVSSTTLPGHIEAKIPEGRKAFFEDTIIYSAKDSLARWYTHGGGDCHARFKYLVSFDKYYPVLLLTEKNFWGGCRAGGFWDFTITFKMPPGIMHHRKNVMLMERNSE